MTESRKSLKSDLMKIDALRDKDIDYSDIPPWMILFSTRI